MPLFFCYATPLIAADAFAVAFRYCCLRFDASCLPLMLHAATPPHAFRQLMPLFSLPMLY